MGDAGGREGGIAARPDRGDTGSHFTHGSAQGRRQTGTRTGQEALRRVEIQRGRQFHSIEEKLHQFYVTHKIVAEAANASVSATLLSAR